MKAKLNKITLAILTAISCQLLSAGALADAVIQKGSGEFIIVTNEEAKKVFDRNHSGFFAIPASPTVVNVPKISPRPKKIRVKTNSPITKHEPQRPVTTVAPAESIFIRMEKK